MKIYISLVFCLSFFINVSAQKNNTYHFKSLIGFLGTLSERCARCGVQYGGLDDLPGSERYMNNKMHERIKASYKYWSDEYIPKTAH